MKRILAVLLITIIAVGYFGMPRMVSSAIPTAYYITPDQKTYENTISCTGTIQSANVREIYLQSAIVPAEICVGVGDAVFEGDTLALIDRDMTEKMSLSGSIIQSITESALSSGTGNAAEGIDWASLASSYGLTAVLNGSGYSGLQSLIEGGLTNNQDIVTAGTIVGGDKAMQIISPMNGTVTEVNIRSETPVSAGKAIFTITDTNKLKVLASVSESDISKINLGDMASVRGTGFAGSVYSGTVNKIYPTARKPLTGSDAVVDVEIELQDADENLKPGFTAKVEITGGNNYEITTVPYEAIRQDENNNEYVYVYNDGKLMKRVVTTGQELTNEVEILYGLDSDSVVVYNPNGTIREGQMINLVGRASVN